MEGYEFIDGAEIWRFHATHGFPIEISIPLISERGMMITWLELLAAAKQDGASLKVLIPRLCSCVQDAAWSKETRDEICRRLQEIGAHGWAQTNSATLRGAPAIE